MRCLRPLRMACTALCSSTAFARQAIRNAVNERDSPVFAFCSRRNVRALFTSTSSKTWIMGLWWVERYAAAIHRRYFGYETILESACCCFMRFLPPSDETRRRVTCSIHRHTTFLFSACFHARQQEPLALGLRPDAASSRSV